MEVKGADQTKWQQGPAAEPRAQTIELGEAPQPSHWELRTWTTYTWPAYVLIAGMVISLVAMLRLIMLYRRARRRRIDRWNDLRRMRRDDSAFT